MILIARIYDAVTKSVNTIADDEMILDISASSGETFTDAD